MPQALAAAIVTAVGITGAAATVATAVLTVAITYGTSQAIGAIFGPSKAKPSDGQQTVRAAVGPRFRSYGIVHSAGQLSFFESRNGTLARVITLDTGEQAEILEHRLDDKAVTLDGSGVVQGASFHGAIKIYTRPGSDNQTAISQLTALFPEWTADHRQRGCPHAAILCGPVEQEEFGEVYNGRIPEYTQIRKAVKLYDPRKDSTAVIGYDGAGEPVHGAGAHRLDNRSTWEWSDNGALVEADFAAHEDGYGLGYGNINWTNIAAEADIADENVTTIGGGTVKRWRIWARYNLVEEERRQILNNMQLAIDGFCWQDADAKFNLKVGRWEEPTVTLTDDHILSLSASTGPQTPQRVSALKGLYTEAANGYREEESATWPVPGSEDDPNTSPQPVRAYYAPHHNQAARVVKLAAAKLADDRWHFKAVLNLFGLNLIGERFCRVETDRLGVYAYFEIEQLGKLDLENMRVEATLSEVRPEDWDFVAAEEEGTPPVSSGPTGGAVTIPVPAGLALVAGPVNFGETNGVVIVASWAAPRAGLVYQCRYRPAAGGDWAMMNVVQEALVARSAPVNSGIEYEVQVRSSTILGRTSEWSASVTITPVAVPVLGAPSSLSATGGTGEATVSFSMPASASLDHARVYGADSDDFGTAAQVGGNIVAPSGAFTAAQDTGLPAGTRYYWAQAFDGSGGSSALVGPVSATIS